MMLLPRLFIELSIPDSTIENIVIIGLRYQLAHPWPLPSCDTCVHVPGGELKALPPSNPVIASACTAHHDCSMGRRLRGVAGKGPATLELWFGNASRVTELEFPPVRHRRLLKAAERPPVIIVCARGLCVHCCERWGGCSASVFDNTGPAGRLVLQGTERFVAPN